jgi:UDPglucose 6-dehydrogenase
MKKKVKLGIVGHGFVGQAVEKVIKKSVDIFIVDPIYRTTIEDLKKFNPHLIIICAPTPMNNDGTQDSSIVFNILENIKDNFIDVNVVLKSTVLPDTLEQLNHIFPLVYNPEFLREKHAFDDMVKSELNILAGDEDKCGEIKRFFINHSKIKSKKFIITDLKTASLVKYTLNTFLATKVLFFNQIYKIHKELAPISNWDAFTSILSSDSRIGSTHMEVPGPDGRYGYGGACFPKDVKALIKYSDTINKNFTLLEEVNSANNLIRKKYKTLDSREAEQNVNFD